MSAREEAMERDAICHRADKEVHPVRKLENTHSNRIKSQKLLPACPSITCHLPMFPSSGYVSILGCLDTGADRKQKVNNNFKILTL